MYKFATWMDNELVTGTWQPLGIVTSWDTKKESPWETKMLLAYLPGQVSLQISQLHCNPCKVLLIHAIHISKKRAYSVFARRDVVCPGISADGIVSSILSTCSSTVASERRGWVLNRSGTQVTRPFATKLASSSISSESIGSRVSYR